MVGCMSGTVRSWVSGKIIRCVVGWTCAFVIVAIAADRTIAEPPTGADPVQAKTSKKEDTGEPAWQLPGRVSLYNLQFGPAAMKDNEWKFLSDSRTFNAAQFKHGLTLMIRFSYYGSRSEIPLKFVIRLPDSRPYEETVSLMNRQGTYTYHFTVHDPENFLGSGSVYLYYGFSIIDVLDFTIVSGS